jgi:probable rRNA maturation factor
LSIRIFYDETNFRLNGWKKVVKIIEQAIFKEQKIPGDLNFIMTNDEILKKINFQFMKRDYSTDVITFNYNVKNVINGEIYISMETVQENAVNYNVSLKSEVLRVAIHGILHLLGYDDKSKKEKAIMKRKENMWLRVFENELNGF